MATTWEKRPGIHVFAPHDDAQGECVLAQVLAAQPWRRDIEWPVGFEAGIVHRLDGSTSGALLIADDLQELAKFRAWFSSGLWQKSYVMLAARDVPWCHHRCKTPIGHARRRKGRMVVQRGRNTPHRGQWMEADTEFFRVDGSLFRVVIRTGVMHQIRVHSAFVGLPLLGDGRYGGGSTPEQAPPGVTFFLHHVGMKGPDGCQTEPVTTPGWASAFQARL